MKRIISLIIIVTMMVFSLTSCDELAELLGESDINSDSESKDELKDDSESVTYTITKEDWNALDSITNYTIKLTGSSYSDQNETSRTKIIYKSSGTDVHEETMFSNNGSLSLYDKFCTTKDGICYGVARYEDGNWYATKYDWELKSLLDYLESELLGLKFEDLIYSEENKAYIYTENEDDAEITILYHFKNGKLLNIEGKAVSNINGEEHIEELVNVEISHIGLTSVVVPQYTILEEE